MQNGLILPGFNDEVSFWNHTFILVFLCAFLLWHALNLNSMNESSKSALVERLVLMRCFIGTISLGCHSQELPCTSFQQAEDKRRASTSLHRLFATECCWQCRNNTGAKAKNTASVYLLLLELKEWHAQWSAAAFWFKGTLSSLFPLSGTHSLKHTHKGSLSLCFLHVGGC